MSLQVTAYKKLVELEDVERDAEGRPVDETAFYAHPDVVEFVERSWRGYTKGLRPGAAYGYREKLTVKQPTSIYFNTWRRLLLRMVAINPYEWEGQPQPFAELTDFADRDGIFGPTVAKKLAQDFANWQYHADVFATHLDDNGEFWLRRYNEWRKVFEMAADGGAVEMQ